MIDNFDSFTYNLVQYIGELGAELDVFRNNAIDTEEIRSLKPDGIVISPGPGYPDAAGNSLNIINELSDSFPVLGVCLGHQVIGQAFGAKIGHAPELLHGKTSLIIHNNQLLFKDVPSPFQAARYHSLVIQPESLPACLTVTARTEDGTIMGIAHERLSIYGIQFHPESFLTAHGKQLLSNFLSICKKAPTNHHTSNVFNIHPKQEGVNDDPTISS